MRCLSKPLRTREVFAPPGSLSQIDVYAGIHGEEGGMLKRAMFSVLSWDGAPIPICVRFGIAFNLAILTAATNAFGHGEDTAGPHGGEIRMPGAFHTELVITKDPKVLRVYLLDISFKDPVTQGSDVTLTFVPKLSAGVDQTVVCRPMRDYFECVFRAPLLRKAGTLEIVANRQGVKGDKAVYWLP